MTHTKQAATQDSAVSEISLPRTNKETLAKHDVRRSPVGQPWKVYRHVFMDHMCFWFMSWSQIQHD